MTLRIPFFGIDRQYATLKEELLYVTDQVYRSGKVLDGNCTKTFESEIATRCDRTYAVAVNSCTQGLIFALSMSQSKNVLIPAVSFAATVNSVLQAKRTPVFADVDYNALIDLESIQTTLKDSDIGTIMYANLFGDIVDYDKFRVLTEFFTEKKPYIIEDAAQSFGASYKGIPSGKLGDISVLSFDPTKNLPNYGSGGMILTDDLDTYGHLLDLRDNGKYGGHYVSGTNSKMSESDCAQMLVKLQYFDGWQARRKSIAHYYMENLVDNVISLRPGPDVQSAWHKFVIRTLQRGAVASHLHRKCVETRTHYPTPLDQLPVLDVTSDYLCKQADLFCKETLSLPIYPEMTDTEVERVVQAVNSFYK